MLNFMKQSYAGWESSVEACSTSEGLAKGHGRAWRAFSSCCDEGMAVHWETLVVGPALIIEEGR